MCFSPSCEGVEGRKARARARERTREKMRSRRLDESKLREETTGCDLRAAEDHMVNDDSLVIMERGAHL
ncbi:hypothetical protein SLA2020_269410 [Shorea laevis]